MWYLAAHPSFKGLKALPLSCHGVSSRLVTLRLGEGSGSGRLVVTRVLGGP